MYIRVSECSKHNGHRLLRTQVLRYRTFYLTQKNASQLFHYWKSLLMLFLVLLLLPSSFWLSAALGAGSCLLSRKGFNVPGNINTSHFIPLSTAFASKVEPNFWLPCDGGLPCGPIAAVSTKWKYRRVSEDLQIMPEEVTRLIARVSMSVIRVSPFTGENA